jgi:hypothetical protein
VVLALAVAAWQCLLLRRSCHSACRYHVALDETLSDSAHALLIELYTSTCDRGYAAGHVTSQALLCYGLWSCSCTSETRSRYACCSRGTPVKTLDNLLLKSDSACVQTRVNCQQLLCYLDAALASFAACTESVLACTGRFTCSLPLLTATLDRGY